MKSMMMRYIGRFRDGLIAPPALLIPWHSTHSELQFNTQIHLTVGRGWVKGWVWVWVSGWLWVPFQSSRENQTRGADCWWGWKYMSVKLLQCKRMWGRMRMIHAIPWSVLQSTVLHYGWDSVLGKWDSELSKWDSVYCIVAGRNISYWVYYGTRREIVYWENEIVWI